MTQNNNQNGKSPAITTAPQGKQGWKIEYPLEGGGTISFTGEAVVDILAVNKSIQAIKEATCCTLCNSHNTRLIQRQMSGQYGDYTQYNMICDDCGAGYSFSANADHPGLLTTSINEKYRGWQKYDQANGNGNTNRNNQSSQQRNTQPSQRQNQGRPQQQSSKQNDESDGWENWSNDDEVPF